jgi:hypothetical protein
VRPENTESIEPVNAQSATDVTLSDLLTIC